MDISGQTPLLIASRSRNHKAVHKLMEAGADAALPDRSGLTTLHWSASNGSNDLIQTIITTGKVSLSLCGGCPLSAEVNLLLIQIPVDIEDSHLQSPLHMAAMNGQLSSATKLLEHGADINKKTIEGITPLYNAAKKSQHNLMELLLLSGAEYLACNNGKTPMDLIIDNNSPHSLSVLLKHRPHLLSEVMKRLENDEVSGEFLSAKHVPYAHVNCSL